MLSRSQAQYFSFIRTQTLTLSHMPSLITLRISLPLSWMARATVSGDIGGLKMRTPQALYSALAMAGAMTIVGNWKCPWRHTDLRRSGFR